MLASGWRRATPIGSSYGQETSGNQIDHILYSKPCTCENASLIRNVGDFAVCEGPNALSDHAILVSDVRIAGQTDAHLYSIVDP